MKNKELEEMIKSLHKEGLIEFEYNEDGEMVFSAKPLSEIERSDITVYKKGLEQLTYDQVMAQAQIFHKETKGKLPMDICIYYAIDEIYICPGELDDPNFKEHWKALHKLTNKFYSRYTEENQDS